MRASVAVSLGLEIDELDIGNHGRLRVATIFRPLHRGPQMFFEETIKRLLRLPDLNDRPAFLRGGSGEKQSLGRTHSERRA